MEITTDDLMDALRAALGTPGGEGHTVQEMVVATGWGDTKVRAILGDLNRRGRLVVSRVKRTDLSGRMQSVPAYRMKDA
jgi:hypothetical protein